MAKGNPFLGTLSGSIGDVTMYRARGAQVSRARIRQVGNPRSAKQQQQRMVLATVSQFLSRLSPVLNNAVEGVSGRAQSLARLNSLNMRLLRSALADGAGLFTPKGWPIIAPNDYVVSRGSLRGVDLDRSLAARELMATGGVVTVLPSSLVVGDGLTASQVFPTVDVGDQITPICYATVVGETDQPFSSVLYCRFAASNDVLPLLVPLEDDPDVWQLNPDAIDISKAAGPWRLLRFEQQNAGPCFYFSGNILPDDFYSGSAVIVSREAGRLRSSASFVSASVDIDYYAALAAAAAAPTYGNEGTPIDLPSDVYLDNSAGVSPSASVSRFNVAVPGGSVLTNPLFITSEYLLYINARIAYSVADWESSIISFVFRSANPSLPGSVTVEMPATASEDTPIVIDGVQFSIVRPDEIVVDGGDNYLSFFVREPTTTGGNFWLDSVTVRTPAGDIYKAL